MKTKIFILLLSLVSSELFAFCIVDPRDTYKEDMLEYPLLFLKGNKEIEKDEAKAFALLLDIENLDIAKLWIAYCYEYGIGCEKDTAKSDATLAQVKNEKTLTKLIYKCLSKDFESLFALKLANLYYAKTGKLESSYSTILRDSIFKSDYPEAHAKILALAEKDKANLYKTLLPIYEKSKDYAKSIELLDYIKEIDKGDYSTFGQVQSIFYGIIRKGDISLLESFLAKRHIETLLVEKLDTKLLYAFCYFYGIGCQIDEAKANELIDAYIKKRNEIKKPTNWNHVSPINDIKDSKFSEGKDFVFHIANKVLEYEDEGLIALCYLNAIGVDRDVEKAIRLYHKSTVKGEINYSLESILDFFKKYYPNPTPELQNLLFDMLCLEIDMLSIKSLGYFLSFEKMGFGTEENKQNALKAIEKRCEIRPLQSNSSPYNVWHVECHELRAYCYEYGIGTEKDEAKAESIRAEMQSVIEGSRNEDSCYKRLRDLYTSDPKCADIFLIYSPKNYQYYNDLIENLKNLKL